MAVATGSWEAQKFAGYDGAGGRENGGITFIFASRGLGAGSANRCGIWGDKGAKHFVTAGGGRLD
jgi:hypothetical protein